jgi:uncharacterized membrane protein
VRNKVISMEQSPDKDLGPTHSNVAVAGHPLHPMLITFPIAFLLGAFASALVYLYDRDPFWARMSIWLIGAGTIMGTVAGVTGTAELLSVRGIRRFSRAWNHFVASVVMLAVAFANWMWRVGDVEAAIWPWGVYMSALTAGLVAFAGWLGGALVFEHQIVIEQEE